MKNGYEDIINLPHHVSENRVQMPLADRAAQFSPFAALSGYEIAIKESERLTEKRIELGEEIISELNLKQRYLNEVIAEHPSITVTYFAADKRKDGGAYIAVKGNFKGIDEINRLMLMTDGKKIFIDEIVDIQSEIFKDDLF